MTPVRPGGARRQPRTSTLSGGARRSPHHTSWPERILIVLASLVISIGVIALLSGGFLGGKDSPGLYGSGGQLGVQVRDQGDGSLAPGARRPRYDSVPPTSGPHHTVPILRDESVLSDDQLLSALAPGNVVLEYGSPRPPAGLKGLATGVAAPFTPALAAAGQAVILARRPGLPGVLALAWTRLLHVGAVTDPQLRSFAATFLGQGAGHD